MTGCLRVLERRRSTRRQKVRAIWLPALATALHGRILAGSVASASTDVECWPLLLGRAGTRRYRSAPAWTGRRVAIAGSVVDLAAVEQEVLLERAMQAVRAEFAFAIRATFRCGAADVRRRCRDRHRRHHRRRGGRWRRRAGLARTRSCGDATIGERHADQAVLDRRGGPAIGSAPGRRSVQAGPARHARSASASRSATTSRSRARASATAAASIITRSSAMPISATT